MVAEKAKALGLDALFTGLAVGYVILFFVVLALVLWLVRSSKGKAIGAIVITGLFAILPVRLYVSQVEYAKQAEKEDEEYRARYAPAKALFDKLCKEQAGEKIYRTVENVEGILLLRVRPVPDELNFADPLWTGAALPDESGGEGYIKTFLWFERPSSTQSGYDTSRRGVLTAEPRGSPTYPAGWPKLGYRFVDVTDSVSGSRNRYSWDVRQKQNPPNENEYGLNMNNQPGPLARYAVTFQDDIDLERRKHWVAGTAIKVVDTTTGEIIATKTFFAFEAGFGNTNQRTPWRLARACPGTYIGLAGSQTRMFLDQVLKPSQSQIKKGK